MQQGAHHHRDAAGSAEDEADGIDAHHQREVFAHDAHGGAGKAAQFGDHHRVIATDDHVAGLDGDIRGLAAQGNADVGIGQCRGVVDAVANHHHAVALRLQLEHCLGFLLGKELGLIAVRAYQLGHSARLWLHIAGKQFDISHAVVAQAVDGTAHVLARPVHGVERRDDALVHAHIGRNGALYGLDGFFRAHAVFRHVAQVAHAHHAAVHFRAAAARDLGDGLAMGGDLRAQLAAIGEDGARQRVRAGLLGGHGQRERRALVHIVRVHAHGDHLRPALGDGAGLVEQHGVGVAHLLDVSAALDEYAFAHRRVDGGGKCRGGGELDAAGIVDDQHFQRFLRVARHQPHREAQQEIERHKVVGKAVSIALDGRFFQFARLHHADDAGDHGLVAHLGHTDAQVAALDHRAREDLVARGLFRRLKFAGNGALVNDRRAGDDRAVYGQLFAGVCLHLVARPDPVDGAALHAAVGQHFPGVLILHGEHLLDGRARALDGVRSHHLGKVGKREDHQRRVGVAEQQAGYDGGHREKVGVGPQFPAQPARGALCHRPGKPQADQRLHAGELAKPPRPRRAAQRRIAQQQRSCVDRQAAGELAGGHARLRVLARGSAVAGAHGVHGKAGECHFRVFLRGLGVQAFRVVFKEHAFDGCVDPHAAHASKARQRLRQRPSVIRQEAQPCRGQAQPARQAVAHPGLHPILIRFPFQHITSLLLRELRRSLPPGFPSRRAAAAWSAACAPGGRVPLHPQPWTSPSPAPCAGPLLQLRLPSAGWLRKKSFAHHRG